MVLIVFLPTEAKILALTSFGVVGSFCASVIIVFISAIVMTDG